MPGFLSSTLSDFLGEGQNVFEKTGNKSICLNTDFYGLIDENSIVENTSFENVYIGNQQNMQENIPMGAIMMHL